MTSFAAQERFLNHSTAQFNFEQTINTLGLSYTTKKISSFTSICNLKKHNVNIERGNGKGIGFQSELSAQYEALEHYLLTTETVRNPEFTFLPYSLINASGKNTALSTPFREMLERCDLNQCMPWVNCNHLYKDHESWVPFISINPLYNSENTKQYKKFCSSNGSAIGTNKLEASIHGLAELIERDALSCFLYSSFVAKKYLIKKVKKNTIPSYLFDLVHEIEDTFDENLIILDITTDLGIPVYLVSFTHQDYPIQPIGSGCSFHRTYALERSILEAIQMKDLSVPEERKKDQAILDMFKSWPAYYNSTKVNLKSIVNRIPEVKFKDHTHFECPENIYKNLISILNKNDIDVYKSVIYNTNKVACIKMISPQLEQFHPCQSGYFTIPGDRIRRLHKNGH